MTTSIRDLLDAARRHVEGDGPNQRTAQAAITALSSAARALRHVSEEPATGRSGALPDYVSRQLVIDLADTSATTARGWLAAPGTLPDLVGAAADIAGRLAPRIDPQERWAIAVAFAETARRCTHAAQAHEPYGQLLPLRLAYDAAIAVEQHAALHPPTTPGATVLDRGIPAPHPTFGPTGVQAATEAASALLHTVRAAVAQHRLTVGEALAAAVAARTVAIHGAMLASTLARSTAVAPPWRAAPTAWQVVHAAYAPFDDGTKMSREPSAIVASAVRLHDQLRREFTSPSDVRGPQAHSQVGAIRQLSRGGDLDLAATELRAMAHVLPDLAVLLRDAAYAWETRKELLAPERLLHSYEDRNAAVTTTDRVVNPEAGDLDDVYSALEAAGQLSTSLSVQLDQTAALAGRQPQPHIAAAEAETLNNLDPGELAQKERAVALRSAAHTPPRWAARARISRPASPRRCT